MCKSVKAGLKNGHKKIFQSEDETVWIPPSGQMAVKVRQIFPLLYFKCLFAFVNLGYFLFLFVCLFWEY